MNLNLIVLVGILVSCSTKKIEKKLIKKVGDSAVERKEYDAKVQSNEFYLTIDQSLNLNQKNYLIDLDGDKQDELITLEESYSKPT